MSQILLLSLAAALNPALLAATTLMLVLPSPKKLLFGYLCGALMTSITLGCLIVFAVGGDSSGTSTSEHTLNPVWDLALGGLILACAFVVGTGRDTRRRERAERKKVASADEPPPKWKQALSKGSARTTFVVGALLTLPGAAYLAGLSKIAKEDVSDPTKVLLIVGFNVVMLILLELPLIGYTLRPDKTQATVDRVSAWLSRNGGRIALIGATVIGVVLIGRGAGGLLA